MDDYFRFGLGYQSVDAGRIGKVGRFVDDVWEEVLIGVPAGHVDLAAVLLAENGLDDVGADETAAAGDEDVAQV